MNLRPALCATTVLVLAAGVFLFVTSAHATVTIPDCTTLGRWVLKFDRNALWQPNVIGSRTQIPSLLASEETTILFKKPMVSWTESEAKAIRDSVLACRKAIKDKAESSAYNAVQSALISRVANFANALAQARPKTATALETLKTQPASLPLLRFHVALAEAVTLNGYNQAQRVAGGLPGPAAAAARNLMTAMRELPQDEIVQTVAKPAAATAEAMRAGVVQGLIADVKKTPATSDGLAMLGQMAQVLPRDYGAALGAEALKTVQQAVAERREGVADEIATVLVTQIGQSSQGMDAFADIDRRANLAFLPQLPAPLADKVLAAANARREVVTEKLLKDMTAKFGALPATDESIQAIDREVLPGIRAWPASANAVRPRFEAAATERRKTILEAVTRAERGSLRGRTYASASGEMKMEFVDRTRVFITGPGGQTIAGTYEEEGDSRVLVTAAPNPTMVLTREGKRLVGGPMPLRRLEAK
jgi:pantothenate kinase type III